MSTQNAKKGNPHRHRTGLHGETPKKSTIYTSDKKNSHQSQGIPTYTRKKRKRAMKKKGTQVNGEGRKNPPEPAVNFTHQQ